MNRFLENIEANDNPPSEHLTIGYMQQEPHFSDSQSHNQDLYGRHGRTVQRVRLTSR
jgi:hypothetical protein